MFSFTQIKDVLCVTRQLAKVLDKEGMDYWDIHQFYQNLRILLTKHMLFKGRNILASGSVFTFSPTQMYCITRQLQLPHVAIAESGKHNHA